MSDKFQNQFRIESARAQWWNYGWNAAYFVTICTAHREHYFGEIINGKPVETGHCPVSHFPVSTNVMQLSEIGRLTEKFWRSIPEHFPFVKLDVFVVMPNHIHGILMIDKPNDNRDMDRIGEFVESGQYVETGQCPVFQENIDDTQTKQCLVSVENIDDSQTGQCPVSTNDATHATEPKTPGELRFRNQGKETLSSIVGSFKSVVTKYAHYIHADFEWQERFHDHIIRDTEEYCKIANYIENNVTNWQNDKFYD